MIVNFDTFSDRDEIDSFLYQTPQGAPIAINPLASLRMQARSVPGDPTVLVDCSTTTANVTGPNTGNGRIVLTNAAIGAFTLTIPVAVLLILPPGVYSHSLIMTDPVTLLRTEIWRGTLTHAYGTTLWALGTL